MKCRDLIRLVERDGWKHIRTTGSHLQYQHPTERGTVTISAGGKLSRDVPPGTLHGRRQARLP